MNIGNMIMRIFLRKIIGMGINKGMNMASGAGRKGQRQRVEHDPYADEVWDGDEGDAPVRRNRKNQRR